ncbi:MAG: hypothetical protein IIV26_04555 [Peptococcaceae bacterium]|jgi:hypothetical protein|nr:hypothetical protein [Peptococcaceae bacterium]
MYAYYLQKGHRLDELLNLSFAAKLFYKNAMELEQEKTVKMLGGGEHS